MSNCKLTHLPFQVSTAPPGAQASTLDIDSAFRNIPILPQHKPFLVIQVDDGEFYIDHVCPFGIASGPGLQGQPMDAIVDILGHEGIERLKKWVDDLINFRFPIGQLDNGEWIYAYDIEDIFRITAALGVPWKLGKCFRYAFLVVYLGFLWNLKERCVSLPNEKRAKYQQKLDTYALAAESGRVKLRETMSIAGTLSHIAFVYREGRAYLANLFAFAASFPNQYVARYPPSSLKSDLRWWRDILQLPTYVRSLVPRAPPRDCGVWVDASTDWGIGIIIDGRWAAWKLVPGCKGNGRDIGWAEMIAIELTTLHLTELSYRDTDLILHSDNMGVIGAVQRGNFEVNLSIRRTALACCASNILILPQYVNTSDNLADPVSRGILGPASSRLPILTMLPKELHAFLDYV